MRHHYKTLITALAAGSVAWLAQAQQEQWLEYHTSTETQGYRWIEVSTNRPANVAMPKDLRASACFGRWDNAIDKGRWFAMDRAGKSGSYDRIFFDLNGDGSLADESPSKTTYNDGNSGFAPLKIIFKGEDGPVAYHLMLQSYEMGEGRVQLLASSAGWYEGMVDFGGKKYRVKLRDNTINGAFNDSGRTPSAADLVLISTGSNSPEVKYIGKYIEVAGQLYTMEVAKDGAFVKVKKAEGVAFGKVQVPETIAKFEVMGDAGSFQRQPAKGEVSLPVGSYRVMQWTANRKDAKGVSFTLRGSGFGDGGDFVVAADKPASVRVGEPIRTQLDATESKTTVSFSLKLLGPCGETVDIMRGTDRPKAPQLILTSLTGDFRSTNTFEYG